MGVTSGAPLMRRMRRTLRFPARMGAGAHEFQPFLGDDQGERAGRMFAAALALGSAGLRQRLFGAPRLGVKIAEGVEPHEAVS